MANANPNRAMAQAALAKAEADLKAAAAALAGETSASTTSTAPAVTPAPKPAQAINQKAIPPKRSLRPVADSSNLREDAAVKIGSALSVVSQYINASKAGTPAQVAQQKFNELIAAINAGA